MNGLGVVIMLMAAQAGSSVPAKRYAAEKSADKRDKMICKRFIETGSLVRGKRICQTKREWDRDRDNIRAPETVSNGCNGPSCH